MATIVLVPGGCLGAWVWSRVTPLLSTAGHDPHPLTLSTSREADLTTWVEDVAGHIHRDGLDEAVLVGHSFGGTVITAAAERVPQRLARLVYLDGLILSDRESVFDALGPELAGYLEQLATDGQLPWFTDEQLDHLYGDHGLTAEDLRWMRQHITAQPLATYREALPIGDPDAAAIPRTYIRCTRTPTPPPIAPGTAGWDWAELDAGHWPMVTAPPETARQLDAIAKRTSR